MRSLTNEQYLQIIRDNNLSGNYSETMAYMRRWDEARTDINPDAAWYPFDVDTPKEKIEYISRAAVVNTLIEFAKEVYENESIYEPIIETVIELESLISDLPSIWIEKEVTANDED